MDFLGTFLRTLKLGKIGHFSHIFQKTNATTRSNILGFFENFCKAVCGK